MTIRDHHLRLTATLLLLLILCCWWAMGVGSRQGHVTFDPNWPQLLWNRGDVLSEQIARVWRAPRVLAAILVGASLALAGLLLQGITRNPLADPYLLGVSGGAGLCVVGLHSLVDTQLPWWSIPCAAFVGAMLAMVAVMALARGTSGRLSMLGLILAGVVINALCAASMAFLLARFDPFRLRVTSSWLSGGIGFTSWPSLACVGSAVVVAWILLRASAHRLNAFALGTEGAALVGVAPAQLVQRTAIVASLLAAFGVTLAGLLGYVGLIVPHAIRLCLGSDFRKTLAPTPIAGALLLVGADTAGRIVFAPEELPVGVLTALLGCPVLLLQLRAQLTTART